MRALVSVVAGFGEVLPEQVGGGRGRKGDNVLRSGGGSCSVVRWIILHCGAD